MGALSRSLASVAVLLGFPGSCIASEADVVRFFELIAAEESGGRCDETSFTSTAMGCYQLTEPALVDAKFKDADGNWVPNEYNITSDEEFLHNPEANYAAMLEYTKSNWRTLTCRARALICEVFPDLRLDTAALLVGAHILGASGVRRFLECAMEARCISQKAADKNTNGDKARFREIVAGRMAKMAAENLYIPELTMEDPRGCGPAPSCPR